MKTSLLNKFNTKNGYLIHDVSKCTLCGICEKKCPHKAIKVRPSGWKLRLVCMKCGRCLRECPGNALKLISKRELN